MDERIRLFLLDWTVNFIKNRDLISKKIEIIEKEKNGFDLYVKYRDKEQYFLILPTIESFNPLMKRINDDAYFCIVTLNSAGNLNAILKSWKEIIQFKSLSIIFVNPFSSLDKRWIVFPSTHNKISGESSLELGLKSMFETVEPISEQIMSERITKL